MSLNADKHTRSDSPPGFSANRFGLAAVPSSLVEPERAHADSTPKITCGLVDSIENEVHSINLRTTELEAQIVELNANLFRLKSLSEEVLPTAASGSTAPARTRSRSC